jgi:lysosomal alpha-mannosidase
VAVPAMSFSEYRVNIGGKSEWVKTKDISNIHGIVSISNEFYQLTFSNTDGLTTTIKNLRTNMIVPFEQTVRYYFGRTRHGASGAYSFRPDGTSFGFTNVSITNITIGQNCEEVTQQFDSWATVVVRLCKRQPNIEFEWTVGPIKDDDNKGREVVMSYETNLVTNGLFYTDANGRQMILRGKDRRDYPFHQSEPVSGNYYPINSHAWISSNEVNSPTLMVMTDRSQGGGSISDGQLEIMVHRITMYDDYFGVGEPVKEKGVDGKNLIVRGKHYVYFDSLVNIRQTHKHESTRLFYAPLYFLTNQSAVRTWSVLNRPMPLELNILTLDQWKGDNVKLLRIEHVVSIDDNPLVKPQLVDLSNLFRYFRIVRAVELNLSGNQYLSEMKRLQWKTAESGDQINVPSSSQQHSSNPLLVTINPMEIRTYEITIQY